MATEGEGTDGRHVPAAHGWAHVWGTGKPCPKEIVTQVLCMGTLSLVLDHLKRQHYVGSK